MWGEGMNDRELLGLAAKAAGMDVLRNRLDDPMWRDFLLRSVNPGDAIGWNPLTNDGDALRLAVKLSLDIEINQISVGALYSKHLVCSENCVPATRDAATRRAIVRAAAEIGKAM